MKSYSVVLLSAFALSACSESRSPAPVAQAPTQELGNFLQDFYRDSREAMNRVPTKRDQQGRVITETESPFGDAAIRSGDYLATRDQVRTKISRRFSQSRPFEIQSAPATNDRVENLVELPTIMRSLREMEENQLTTQELKRRPWSDSYWPMNRGMTGVRYADPSFPASNDWSRNFEYISRFPAQRMLAEGHEDNLAPSEKYDFLMGDTDFTLTQGSWSSAKDREKVEIWPGICDGWSASAIFDDEPVRTIAFKTDDGRKLRFFPSDIKGLSSLLWAKGNYLTKFLGARCTIKNPPTDEVGRTIAPECLDSNPGTWHLAVVNQLGVAKRSLIIDATYDYEIWNYPVWKYEYSYFNPQTLQTYDHWRDAVVPYDRFKIDKFRKYRSPQTKYVAGISMVVSYMVENMPSHREGSLSTSKSVHYIYDLELDSNLSIVGGEWYVNRHPDFIWVPQVGARAVSSEDGTLGDPAEWSGDGLPPSKWTQASRNAAQKLQPLAAVVNRLIQLSHAEPKP